VIPGIAILLLFLLPFYDTNPKRHPLNRPVATTVMTIIVIGMVVLTYISEVTKPPASAQVAAGPTKAEIIKAGAKLFEENCASCHGPDGKGVEGVTHLALNSDDFLNTRTDEVIHNIIAAGQTSVGMQAFGAASGGPLSDEQIDEIIAYMRSWQEGGAEATPTPQAAAKFDPADYYKKNCAVCHGANAEGKGSFPALDKAATKHDMYSEVILNGKGAMPKFKGKLTEDQVDQIIKWLATK
jgi:cbb3-type cytochrome c oxidase subunit III